VETYDLNCEGRDNEDWLTRIMSSLRALTQCVENVVPTSRLSVTLRVATREAAGA
jgi:hypothetical protein